MRKKCIDHCVWSEKVCPACLRVHRGGIKLLVGIDEISLCIATIPDDTYKMRTVQRKLIHTVFIVYRVRFICAPNY